MLLAAAPSGLQHARSNLVDQLALGILVGTRVCMATGANARDLAVPSYSLPMGVGLVATHAHCIL